MSPADVPTLSQLKGWKHDLVMKDMPSGMHLFFPRVFFFFFCCVRWGGLTRFCAGGVFYNISSKHPNFAKMCVSHPVVMVVLASDFGIGILSKSQEFFVDGTFQTTECICIHHSYGAGG
jgi:hypothetical protein